MKKVNLEGEFIKLDSFLKICDVVSSGGIAKHLIQNGNVLVNDEIETRRGKKLRNNDIVEIAGEKFQVILNEAEKSEA
ncbi:MAG: S4 domain-containing protein YaaA [Tissierellia bacterium]|nr:S4 domain-containing protein YaaA [Tissierellia bacterium]